ETRYKISIGSTLGREEEVQLDRQSLNLDTKLEKRLSDTWKLGIETTQHAIRRDLKADSIEQQINYENTSITLSFLQSNFQIAARLSYSVADDELK
ncbi:MAG: hypothetical protein GWN81_16245, partial [Phycisphaerae bacterium]|nr:hypothetical protein [Phycisphaerae bacterium]NIU10365.1 hypothetical protein [Phycisphaerae bacterium]NIW10786.1 hypothetical protein [Gammaproteobacteria bacterium]NIX29919.1 hypothetical protein [Phycisphaerae bacterium]